MTNNRYKVLLIIVLAGVISYGYLGSGSSLVKISVGGKDVHVELAIEPEVRGRGLQFRTSLTENHGMLFVFPVEGRHAFWMKDTHIPLSIAFINKGGLITQIEDMEPDSLERHTPSDKVKYALEMNGGWFKRNNIHAGGRVTIPPDIKTVTE